MRRFCSAVMTLALLAAQAHAGDKKSNRIILDHWEAAYLQGGRAGYVHTQTLEFTKDGQTLLRTTVELRLKVKRFGNTVVELGMDTGDIATPEGKVVGTHMRQTIAKGQALGITGVVVGEQLRLTKDGTTALLPAPWRDDVVGLHAQHFLAQQRKIKPGDKFAVA